MVKVASDKNSSDFNFDFRSEVVKAGSVGVFEVDFSIFKKKYFPILFYSP